MTTTKSRLDRLEGQTESSKYGTEESADNRVFYGPFGRVVLPRKDRVVVDWGDGDVDVEDGETVIVLTWDADDNIALEYVGCDEN